MTTKRERSGHIRICSIRRQYHWKLAEGGTTGINFITLRSAQHQSPIVNGVCDGFLFLNPISTKVVFVSRINENDLKRLINIECEQVNTQVTYQTPCKKKRKQLRQRRGSERDQLFAEFDLRKPIEQGKRRLSQTVKCAYTISFVSMGR